MQWDTMPIRVPAKAFLTIAEVSAAVGYSTKTIRRWVREGKFPRPKRVAGGKARWSNAAVGAWLFWQQHGPVPRKSKTATDKATPAAPERKKRSLPEGT